MHRQKTKKEILEDLMIQSLNKERSEGDILQMGRKIKSDRNIQLGHNIAHGLDMIELMLMWDVTDEDLIYFSQKHDEFIRKYESGNKDDMDEIMGLFEELKRRTGFNPLTGRIDEGR